MKKIKEVVEVEDAGLIELLGKRVTFFCLNYIYVGKLTGVNDTCIELESPAIVFDTGSFKDKNYKDEQPLEVPKFFISMNCIESFGELK